MGNGILLVDTIHAVCPDLSKSQVRRLIKQDAIRFRKVPIEFAKGMGYSLEDEIQKVKGESK